MIFNSIDFALFFPIVFILYYSVAVRSLRARNVFIVTVSYLFYGWWSWKFLSLIIVSTVVDYFVGLGMKACSSEAKRKILLCTSIVVNLGILGYFKYSNFFIENFISFFSVLGLSFSADSLNVILPVGISFYTFQTLSYSIDVYKRKMEATKDYIQFSAFVCFFPQLVAGPIERASNLLPQFGQIKPFSYKETTEGLKLAAWGMFKKVVIADRLAIFVNTVYGAPSDHEGLALITATVFFAFQIFCDFSGYSDIAIGTSQILGIRLMDNFRRPYFSKSIHEFWKRWHISLSSWFKDYLYIPLGGSRVSSIRWHANIMITFLISGLWHGAKWTFVAWGALNGLYILLGRWVHLTGEKYLPSFRITLNQRVYRLFRISLTFLLICYAWIFFRAESISDAFYITTHLFEGFEKALSYDYVRETLNGLGLNSVEMITALVSIIFLEAVHFVQSRNSIRSSLSKRPFIFRWFVYYSVVFTVVYFGVFEKIDFIYFQF